MSLQKKCKLKPLLTDPSIFNPFVIVKTPHYLFVKVEGLVASAAWLIHVFCRNILRSYYDDEVIKRLALSDIFSLDASYKVPNWIMRWGRSNMCDVLKYGLNEYGENIMQHFASSENHCQLKIVLCMLKHCRLSLSFAFSDVTNLYRHLLECIFPSLNNNLEDHDFSDEN